MVARSTVHRLLTVRSSKRCRIPLTSNPPSRRHASDLSNASELTDLQTEMTSRRIDYVSDHLRPMPSTLLQATLADFLPPGHSLSRSATHLYPGYHLAYFPNPTRLSTLLPDGTDPIQSPGAPFNRRMWAGGSMTYSDDEIRLTGHACRCNEKISDVQIKGHGLNQKIFVQITRRLILGRHPNHPEVPKQTGIPQVPIVEESRTLVFMRDNRQATSTDASRLSPKILKPTHIPDFHHSLVPTPALLFRFSALTFNAHAIHLDKQYCRDTEGHRNLLVHGPLSLVFMLDLLRGRLMRANLQRRDGKAERISYIEYRNMAPLYAEEEMKVCGSMREDRNDGRSWDVWIEGRDGGYAVKGLVKTMIEQKGLSETSNDQAPADHAPIKPKEIRPKKINASRKTFLEAQAQRKVPHTIQNVQLSGMPEKNSEGVVDVISTNNETVTDEAAFQRKLAPVTDISTEDETIPANESTPEDDGALEKERPADEEHEDDNAPYYQR